MSVCVCVQHKRSGEITFYMKGADAVMTSIVHYSDWLDEEVYMYISCCNNVYSVTNMFHV